MKRTALLALAATLALPACGGESPRENAADQLEEAAEQSDPAAAPILENAAENIRDGETGSANAAAQNALQRAGNAQAQGGQAGSTAPPSQQAKSHSPGDPVPPPKVNTGQ